MDSFSYNVVAYPTRFFSQTHPDHLASLAVWFGMNPSSVENCRFLELGCGTGGSLISYAFNLPDAEFVGVDLSENHIAQAQESAREVNLSNVKFYQLDVTKMTVEEFGQFDFIVAHGLFSWVPAFVREKVLSLYRTMLVPNGVGYISYNAYPGAHLREMSRNMMRFHTNNFAEPLEKVENAVALLNFLAANSSGATNSYQTVLREELMRQSGNDVTATFHDDLADNYQPFYFHEFAAELEKNGLQFLSEAELFAMSMQQFAPAARQFLESLDDVVQREQYRDFLSGRVFRQTLVCHQEISPNRRTDHLTMDKFLLSSSIRAVSDNPDLSADRIEKFIGPDGIGFEIEHPLTKAALLHLEKIWGRAADFPSLLQSAKRLLEENDLTYEDWNAEFDGVRMLFFRICSGTEMIKLHQYQPPANIEVSRMPEVNRLSRWQLGFSNLFTTLLNKYVQIDEPVVRRLLELLDGTRDRAMLIERLSEFIKANEEAENKQQTLDNLPVQLEEWLRKLARIGFFSA